MCALDGILSSSDNSKPVSLLSRDQIPPHLRFNRYVLRHYRPQQDWLGCVGSLFYLHNETVNVLTHGAPIVAILATLSTIVPWQDISVDFLPTLHVAAFISPWVGSTAYHLFMNHYKGEGVYKRLLSLDMLGIWIAQNAGR